MVGPLSRYRNLQPLLRQDPGRGLTRSLPIRRLPLGAASALRWHTLTPAESVDLLARRYLGSEELYWFLLDTNGGSLPAELAVGQRVAIPPLAAATQVARKGP